MFSFRHGLLCVLGIVLFVQDAASQDWDGPSPFTDEVAPDVTVADGWNSSFPEFEAIESKYPALIGGTDGGSAGEDTSRLAPRAAKDFYLRVMPLGASIVQGVQSSDNNGFRKLLRQQLRWKGWKVNMVGTKNNGDMKDNDNQGHPGWRIDEVHNEWKKAAVNGLKPNLVLINAGTNDCGQNRDTANAGSRMKSLIDDIYDKVPGVTIVLSTLVKSRNNRVCAEDLSRQYRDLVRNDYSGKRMGLADIDSIIQMSQIDGDGIHPNDEGYRLFAAVWWNAISKLEDGIQPPATDGLIKDDSQSTGQKCPKVAGTAGAAVQTQKGSGHDDGNYKHNRVARGAIPSARIEKGNDGKTVFSNIPNNLHFGDIIKNDPNSDRSLALDDWIRRYVPASGPTVWYFRQNLGGGRFGSSTVFDPQDGIKCDPVSSRVQFADFNGDGFDDFFCIDVYAAVYVALNRGGSPPRFESIGRIIAPSTGPGWTPVFTAQSIEIGDIDGDGRADFCLVFDTITCSRNGGQGDEYFWQGFSTQNGIRGTVFSGASFQIGSVRLGDLNGDYRADILRIGDNGNVETWINRRGRGSGIVPDWVSAGITHEGQPETGIQRHIKFAKIYGSNKLDYVYVKEGDDYYDVLVWENTGSGGTKLKADGTFYCDMRGTGMDDYVWIYADGHSNEIFANTQNPPFWDPKYTFTLKVGAPRTLIHLADWTGNGRCDVLVQNKVTSAVTLWENQWNAGTKTLTFANRGVVLSPGCGKSTGVSIFDRSMRIADIDGDGRADVVCLQRDGKLTAWLNEKGGPKNVGQIKFDEGWDRANIRLADVENSGRADIIWLNKYTGAGSVWKNDGYQGPGGGGGGSSFHWTKRGVLYSPIDRGEVMNFANLGGRGRADLVQLFPVTNEAWTFFNKCPGGGAGGDDGEVVDPGLPTIDNGEEPRYDGFPTADKWIAMGDSYSAGVGAGSLLDNPRDTAQACLTTTNAYPKYLERGYQALGGNRLEFLSCTGDKIENINQVQSHGRPSQLETLSTITKGSYKFATLSIGGNDLGFSKIVKTCVVLGPIAGDCEAALLNAERMTGTPRDAAEHRRLLEKLRTVYRNILDAAADDFTLVVTGYAQFFAEPSENPDCNDGQMQLAAFSDFGWDSRPSLPLTETLRRRINSGIVSFNGMLRGVISEVTQDLQREGITKKRIRFFDTDPIYEGHRFCEKGDRSEDGWPEFTARSWFFSSALRWDILPDGSSLEPRGDDRDPKLELTRRGGDSCDDPLYEWDCALGDLVAADPNMPLNQKEYPQRRTLLDMVSNSPITRQAVMKAFHPKSIAYDAIAKQIAETFGA